MSKVLLVCSIFLFFSQCAYAEDYSVEEIQNYCGEWSSFVEEVAIARDEGVVLSNFIIQMRAYKDSDLITENEYEHIIKLAKLVYREFKEFTPNEIAFSYKNTCVNQLLNIEEI